MFNLFSGQSKDQKEYLKELAFYKEARELLKKTLIENLNLKDMYGDPFMMIVHSHKGKQYDGIKTEKKQIVLFVRQIWVVKHLPV